jgi:predicted cation transporter
MAMAATKPIITLAEKIIFTCSKLIPLKKKAAFYVSTLVIGPMLGSFITEPAAMTLVAMILKEFYFDRGISQKFKYATIGLLFVNVSVGGTLTHFAAPPVLMVASKFGWGTLYMLEHFGYKSLTAVVLSTILYLFIFKNELKGELHEKSIDQKVPLWIMLVHVIFLALVVLNSHHVVVFLPIFLFFLGFVQTTKFYQSPLLLIPSLMVGFFLGGLVVLGGVQAWWLQPLLLRLSDLGLYLGATGLTAITDNAALTYLGSLVELTDSAKYSLVAGAVSGGGLTVIANAPNPAGYGILKESFTDGTISPVGLFLAALTPTIIVMLCFLFLPSFNF